MLAEQTSLLKHTHVRDQVWAHMYMHTETYTHAYTCLHTCLRVHMNSYAHDITCMDMDAFVCVQPVYPGPHLCTQCTPRRPYIYACVHTHMHFDTLTLTPSSWRALDFIAPGPGTGASDSGPGQMTPAILCCHLVATSQMAACRR